MWSVDDGVQLPPEPRILDLTAMASWLGSLQAWATSYRLWLRSLVESLPGPLRPAALQALDLLPCHFPRVLPHILRNLTGARLVGLMERLRGTLRLQMQLSQQRQTFCLPAAWPGLWLARFAMLHDLSFQLRYAFEPIEVLEAVAEGPETASSATRRQLHDLLQQLQQKAQQLPPVGYGETAGAVIRTLTSDPDGEEVRELDRENDELKEERDRL